jgi:arsenate reductase
MDKLRVLFLCTGNSARSQMAEAFLRVYAGDKYEAYSAGLDPKTIHPLTIKVMDEVGIDIRDQHSKALKDYLGKMFFGYVITVCDQADKDCPTIFPGMGKRLHWSMEDPAKTAGADEEKLLKFREIRDKISKMVKDWVDSQSRTHF